MPARLRTQLNSRLVRLSGILVFAGLLAAGFYGHATPWTLEEDGVNFLIGAATIGTERYWPTWSPGWSFLVWLISQASLSLFVAGKLLATASGLAFLAAAHHLIRTLLGQTTANWSTLLAGLTYTVIAGSVLLGSHMTAAALAMAGLALLVSRKSYPWLVCSGLLFGAAVTIRINYLSLLALAPLLITCPWNRRSLLRPTTWSVAVLLGASPLFYVNAVVNGSALDTGQWRLIPLALGNSGAADQFDSMSQLMRGMYAIIAVKWSIRFVFDLPVFAASSHGWLGILGLVGLGTWLPSLFPCLGRVVAGRPTAWLPAAVLAFALPLALAPFDRMYLLFLVPLLCAGVVQVVYRLTTRLQTRNAVLAFLALLAAVDLARNIAFYWRQARATPDYAGAATYARAHFRHDAVILVAGQDLFAYYFGMRGQLNCRSVDGANAETQVDYIVVDHRFVHTIDTCLSNLGLEERQLTRVFETAGRDMTVYQVRDNAGQE